MSDPNLHPKADYGRNTNRPDVLIIGAGISGMCTAIDMIRHGSGRNILIIEKGSQVGGTWNDNVYPGCCCDVFSHLYSFSFEPNPNWSREYPGQEEIQDYLIQVAHKYQLYRHIRFNSSVEEARWDDQSLKWHISIRQAGDLYTITSDFLVSAVGQLNVPKYPDIAGLEAFRGHKMHSARWDWDHDLRGQNVGVIGTGATAAQIIPEVVQSCKSLTIFQRTPAWVMPRHDRPISQMRQMMYKYVPGARQRYRASLMDFRESVFDATFDPNSESHNMVTGTSKAHILSQLPGEGHATLREKITPHYPFSCKRIIVSDDFYPVLTRGEVFLESGPIVEVTPTGVRMKDGVHHELDTLILATGFRTTDFMYPIKIYGPDGSPLHDAWANGASAYLGITVPNLPNFAMLYGPNTNLSYNSLILQIEAQSLYINALISAVLGAKRKGKTLRLEPKSEVVESYNKDVQARLAKSTYADPSCTSWFKDSSGRITTNWCGSAVQYQQRTSFVDWNDFEILGTAAAEVAKRGQTRWRRVVEETQVSDRAACLISLGVMAACASAFYADRLLGWRSFRG